MIEKQTIRLTESELYNIIRESVKSIINETKYDGGMTFISYLKNDFDPKKFKEIEYGGMTEVVNKCKNGLWACPINSKYGWKHWCQDEDFEIGKIAFVFKLKPNAKIYAIDNYDDLEKISTHRSAFGENIINFKELIDNGYDGIYASENAVRELRYTHGKISGLYCWDVESLCIFNPNVIIPLGADK